MNNHNPGIETIPFAGKIYPKFQSTGFAARFAFPFAQELCHGKGLDIGCSRPEWKLPEAVGVDPAIDPQYHAMHLPMASDPEGWDYIFSSHCLEHLDDPFGALMYWQTQLKKGGVLFLYLPHYSQEYWRPWNNRKHRTPLMPEHLQDFFKSTGWIKSFVSGPDLNHSFYAVAQK